MTYVIFMKQNDKINLTAEPGFIGVTPGNPVIT